VKLIGAGAVLLVSAVALLNVAEAATGTDVPPDYLTGDRGATQLKPGEVFVPFPGGGPPPWSRGPLARGPSLAAASKAAQTAIAVCASTAHALVGVSVLDAIGQPKVTMAADGARGWHIYNATRKALTAVGFKEPSSEVAADIGKPDVAARVKPNMTTMAGAVPLMVGSEVIGAIGVSGAMGGDQDEKCAAAGASAIADQLK